MGLYLVLGIKLGIANCKTSALTLVLSLKSPFSHFKNSNFSQFGSTNVPPAMGPSSPCLTLGGCQCVLKLLQEHAGVARGALGEKEIV